MTGLPFSKQQISFAYERSADWANHDERTRELAVVRGIDLDRWSTPSRCAGWTVHDVLRHVGHMNDTFLGALAAAKAGERYAPLAHFDAGETPKQWLREDGSPSPAETKTAFEASTAAIVSEVDALDGMDLVVMSATGPQPWQRTVLHGLFDAVVHERDITEALGCSHPPFPTHEPVLAYALLLAARVACGQGASFSVAVEFGEDVSPLSVSVDGAAIDVRPVPEAPIKAEPLVLLDALAGRGSLDAALAAPTDVLAALGRLSALLG